MAQPSPAGQETGIDVRAQIEEISRLNRSARSAENERKLLELRHDAGVHLLANPPAEAASHPEPAWDELGDGPVPEITPDRLTPEVVRAAILKAGCLIVRGLVDPDRATGFGDDIENALVARQAHNEAVMVGQKEDSDLDVDGYYENFVAQEGYSLEARAWVNTGGGIWAADSPRLTFEMLEMFESAGLNDVIHGYLGEDPVFSVQKCTLRKVAPDAGAGHPGWHQDGRFLGDVRALNVWLTLTHCGDEAPGLYLVPKRIDEFLVTGTEGAIFDWVVSPTMVDEARGDVEIVKPIFEPGDAMLFDDKFLHSTAADPAMPNHRYAIESWFFAPSGFPDQYAPLAL